MLITEWLEAKSSAVVAIALTVITLVTLPISAYLNSDRRMPWGVLIVNIGVPLSIWALEIIVTLLVINNTWRRTVLAAHRDSLMLTFTAPLGTHRYEWNASEIEDVRVESTTRATDRNSLAEMEIHLAGLPLVKLFTDHPMLEVKSVADRVRRAIGLSS